VTQREFFTSALALVFAMGVLALVELAVPLLGRDRTEPRRLRANLGLTAITLLSNWGLASFAAVLALSLSIEGGGLLGSLKLPLALLVAITIPTLDLATYLAHRSMHALPSLWRVHRVHHADAFLDVTTTFRQHPLETLWRFVWVVVPVWALGLPALGVLAYRLASALQAILEHANVRLWRPLEPISLLWVTPNMHKVHHSRALPQTDSNYGNLFSVFDRAFGTFRRTDEAYGVVYGLDDVDPARSASLLDLLRLRFDRTPAREALTPDPSRAVASASAG